MAQTYRNRVDAAGVPSARLGVQASPDAMGAGIGRGLQDVGAAAGDIYRRERAKQDAMVLMDANLQATLLYNKTMYDPETGALNVKGRDALGLHDKTLPKFQEGLGQIEQSLSTEEQRLAFRRIASEHVGQMDSVLLKHTSSEVTQWQDATASASVKADQDSIPALVQAGDVQGAQAKIDSIKRTIDTHAAVRGIDPKVAETMFTEAQSNAHKSIIGTLLAQDQDLAAKQYWDNNKGKLVGSDVADTAKMVEAGSTRAEANRKADAILAESLRDDGSVNLSQVEDSLKGIEDPKVRDATEAKVMDRVRLHEAGRKDYEGQQYKRAMTIMQGTQGLDAKIQAVQKVLPDLYFKNPEWQDAVNKYARFSAEGVEPVQNSKAWTEFMGMSPAERAKLTPGEFEVRYRPLFDNAHYDHALAIAQGERDRMAGKDPKPEFTNTMEFQKRVDIAFSALNPGIPAQQKDWSEDQLKARDALWQQAADRIASQEAKEGRKLTIPELQDIVNQEALSSIRIDGKLGYPTQLQAGQTASKPYDQIPEPKIKEYKDKAKKLGAAHITRDQIERAHGAVLSGKSQEEVNLILAPANTYDPMDFMLTPSPY